MVRFDVWDDLNASGDDGDFRVIEARTEEEAAVLYAEEDTDGLTDGLYMDNAQTIVVRSSDGTVRRFHVRGEAEVRFYAVLEEATP